ncbi:metallophosphoesterase [Acrocarpospora sp. B8E8]|uniref:metallophosphoesterase n=1 Tax=Acrocarpospora sp. B8E8 TaxID=3153572 RepID=UPI00325F4C9C
MRTIAIIPDVQAPYENPRQLKSLINFIGCWQPDEVLQIGDLADFPQPSRWNKDTRGEFEGSIYADCRHIKKNILAPLRAVYDGPVGVITGNHDARPAQYLERHAPALSGGTNFDLDVLLDFDGHGITLRQAPYEIAPGWLAVHGHEGKGWLSPLAGRSALRAANRLGASIVMGHVHRLAVASETWGYQGKQHSHTGFEVGHIMDPAKASYLGGIAGNWQAGFGLLLVEGKTVTPLPIPMNKDGSFLFEGRRWSATPSTPSSIPSPRKEAPSQ